ncbi:hypothetical protein SAY87_006884 [Trapa incisa]|uniref:Dof zinc finger protein n=1 Tax=Trapa incisa TaxID=236973 RepID=A0AAN7K1X2_9MYRT|nr:hypothetical protein SAY87_006884 [Trapa incisa]
MVFSSIPVYLDPPSWPLQQPNPDPRGVVLSTNDAPPQLPPSAPAAAPGGLGQVRPSTMAERARMANIPMPEPGLKCPRCESTNTKFCYFNNYSLSQPRHFCKTCRRYWTCGGALRNVPVGGGCRRNKRSKRSNRSKSPAAATAPAASTSTTSGGNISSSCTSATTSADVILGHNLTTLAGPSQLLPFLPPLHNPNNSIAGNLGMDFDMSGRKIGGIDIEFHAGNTSGSGGAVLQNGLADQQWRLQQFSFFGNNNLQAPSPQIGFYPLEGIQDTSHHQLLSSNKPPDSAQISTVKMEEINRGLMNPSRNFSSGIPGISQFWHVTDSGTENNAWSSELSHGFPSSTNHIL